MPDLYQGNRSLGFVQEESSTSPRDGRRSLMTLPQCAYEAGVSRRFLELEIQRGRLRAIKMSNRICRVRLSDWERYLDSSATVGP
jgi:hypothetical protein